MKNYDENKDELIANLTSYIDNPKHRKNPTKCWSVFAVFFRHLLQNPAIEYNGAVQSTLKSIITDSLVLHDFEALNAKMAQYLSHVIEIIEINASQARQSAPQAQQLAQIRGIICQVRVGVNKSKLASLKSALQGLDASLHKDAITACAFIVDILLEDKTQEQVVPGIGALQINEEHKTALIEMIYKESYIYRQAQDVFKNEWVYLSEIYNILRLGSSHIQDVPSIANLALKTAAKLLCDRLESTFAYVANGVSSMAPAANGALTWCYNQIAPYVSNNIRESLTYGSTLKQSIEALMISWHPFPINDTGAVMFSVEECILANNYPSLERGFIDELKDPELKSLFGQRFNLTRHMQLDTKKTVYEKFLSEKGRLRKNQLVATL